MNDLPARWPQQQRTECWLVDEHGQASLSWGAADGVFNLGYANAEVAKHVAEAIERHDLGVWSWPSQQRDLGEAAFNEALPAGLDRTVFTANTAEALEVAFKIARHDTGRCGVVAATDVGEGARSLGLAVAGPRHRPERRRVNAIMLERVPYGSIDSIDQAIDDTTSAVYVGAVQIETGVIEAPSDYLAAVRRICDERGALMVVDESTCGLLRTGSLWAFERHEITPDLLISGNGLSGGYYPMGACSGAAERFESFNSSSTIHASTFLGNEIAAVVAGRIIDRYLDPDFQVHVADVGDRLGNGVRAVASRYPNLIADVRGSGLLYGVEVTDPIFRDPLIRACSRRGLTCPPSGHEATMLVMPPLVISPGEVGEGLSRLEAALASM
jgi:acetylornithine/N-succinyldiaminopimelate aminotransferase